MTSNEIRNICIESAETYYKYLEENNKGLQQVDVYELEYLQGKDLLLKLRLAAKLFDTEAIFFKLLTNGKMYGTGEIKVVEYDSNKNVLLIKPTDEVKDAFLNKKSIDIKVISDMKFLVERVKQWYELNGAFVALPQSASLLKEAFENLQFLNQLEPSHNQKESLQSLFTNPFTYIWGAPGTGKTQFVLSYALLHYIRNEKKVAILAPTNNAIEQVLRGVLKMTDKAGIERTKILRLGTPSKKFAEEYPEVCEEKGIQKKLEEIDKQINLLERVINYEVKSKLLLYSKMNLLELNKLGELKQKKQATKEDWEKFKNKLKEKELDIKYTDTSLEKVRTEIIGTQKNLKSISHKLTKLFSSSMSRQERKLEELEGKQNNLKKQRELQEYKLSHYKPEGEHLEIASKNAEQDVAKSIGSLKTTFETNENLRLIISKLSIDNFKEIQQQLQNKIEEEKDQLEVDGHLHSEYSGHSIQQLNNFLKQAKQVREKLAGSSTDERLNTVSVVACTLDGYIGRYTDKKLNVSHIFLDEAGYANIIKALTLFNNNVPITFLGDHKQLPPVCEIADWDMQKDKVYENMFLWAQSAIFLESLFSKSVEVARNEYSTNRGFNSSVIQKTSLNRTFRFGSNLARVLGRHVYDNNFSSSNQQGETQILYVDARKDEGIKSRISLNEVRAIQNIVKVLNHDDYVILAPYTKQVKLIGQYLPNDRNNLRILTVHGSQGKEWTTVILSVVDTVDKWFVDSLSPLSRGLNLVNTAVSRAKQQLIIVCDNKCWLNQQGQLITDLIETGEKLQVD